MILSTSFIRKLKSFLNVNNSFRVGIVVFASFITFAIQVFLLPDAGKVKDSRYFQYEFQMNFWAEETHKKFDEIKYSKTYTILGQYESNELIDKEFYSSLFEYHYRVKSLLRVLLWNQGVALNVIQETESMIDKVHYAGELSKHDQIGEKLNDLAKSMKVYDMKSKSIDNLMKEMKETLNNSNVKVSEDGDYILNVKAMNFLENLFKNEEFFLNSNDDPYRFVREFGYATYKVLEEYKNLVDTYNSIVMTELYIKNTLLLLVNFIFALLAFRKEYK